MYALDTNTVSYHLRRQGDVAQRLQALEPQRLAIPSTVVFEVNCGLRRVGRQNLLASFAHFVGAVRTLDFDAEAADHAARIRVELEEAGTPIILPDLLIAATARRHAYTLVTHNKREFSRVPGLSLDDCY